MSAPDLKHLPMTVVFSIAYMDGALEGEAEEILKNWRTVKSHVYVSDQLIEAVETLLGEWDRLTQYGSPIAAAANERVKFARDVLAIARGERP